MAAILAGAIATLAAAAAGAATTITVTSTADTSATACVLRDAIAVANAGGGAVNGCKAAIDTAFTIDFQTGVTGTITLGSPLPTITGNIAIDGPVAAAGIVISGNNNHRVFVVGTSDPSPSLSLNHLTVAHGKAPLGAAGGGIFVETSSRLAVANCTFLDNIATDDSGGAIAINAQAAAAVVNSTFAGNRAHGGGAILNLGTLTATNSTFAGNRATDGAGGGILTGFHATSSLEGTILAANLPGDNCAIVHGDLADEGYNLSDDDSCGFHGAGSRNGVKDTELDLGPLAHNGGPTETIALESGSIAIDAIPQQSCIYAAGLANPCLTTGNEPNQLTCDQRGSIRPALGQSNCDIGAVEGVAAPTLGAPPPAATCEEDCAAQEQSCSEGAFGSEVKCEVACSGKRNREACQQACRDSLIEAVEACGTARTNCEFACRQ